MSSSPFTRSLGAPDTFILTGIARLDGELHATLLDTRTYASHIVTRTPNRDGWQLVSVGGDAARIQTWSAQVKIRGGEVFTIRYQKPPPPPKRSVTGGSNRGSSGSSGASGSVQISQSQMQEAKNAAVNYKEGFTSDGYPDKPPAEMVSKLSRLSTSQREEINRQMIGHRNRGLGMEERRKIYEGMVDREMQRR